MTSVDVPQETWETDSSTGGNCVWEGYPTNCDTHIALQNVAKRYLPKVKGNLERKIDFLCHQSVR